MENNEEKVIKKANRRLVWKNIFIVLIGIILIGVGIKYILFNDKPISAGEIIDGEVVYSENIVNTSYINGKANIELKCVDESLGTVIITSDMIDKIKDNDDSYNKTLKQITNDMSVSQTAVYNMKSAITLGIVNKKTTLKEYYAKVTGFKNSKELVEFYEDAVKLIKKEKNR